MGTNSKTKRYRDHTSAPNFTIDADRAESASLEAGENQTNGNVARTGCHFSELSILPSSKPQSSKRAESSALQPVCEQQSDPTYKRPMEMVAPPIVQQVLQSPGEALPAATHHAMESRFGHDFSSVSVHSDARAQESARAINANAYTLGEHVVFGTGKYDPETASGQKLLTHELAHVIQQERPAEVLPKSLCVGKPDDALEQEAERAAGASWARPDGVGDGGISAYASTTRASVTGVASSPVIQRDRASDLADMAAAGEDDALREKKENLNQPPAMRVSNVTDVSAAQALVAQIESWRGPMQEGAGMGGAFISSPNRVTPEKMGANEAAVSALDDFLVTAGEQSRTLGSFQDALGKARTDYARLKAQVTHLVVTNTIAGGSAADMGQQITQAAGFDDPQAAQERMRKLERNPGLLAVHNQMQDAHDQMVALGQQAGLKQSTVSQTAYQYDSALNGFKTGVPTVNDNPDQAKELSELKEKIENVKKYVGKGLEYAGKGLEAAGVEGAGKVAEHAGPVVDWLTDQFFDAQLNEIQTKITQYNTAHREHAIDAKLDDVRAQSRAFTTAITDFNNTVEAFAHAQSTFRDKLEAFGRAADAGGGKGDHFAQIASVLAEVDTYEAQLDEALRLAYQEQTAAREASSSRKTMEGGPNSGGGRDAGLSYYEPYKFFHSNGGWGYECQRHELHLSSYGTSRGSAEGVANVGINATVDQAVKDLQGFRNEVDPMRQALSKAMDLQMDSGIPTSAGGPAPIQKSANTGL